MNEWFRRLVMLYHPLQDNDKDKIKFMKDIIQDSILFILLKLNFFY